MKPIKISKHAYQQMIERGATEAEVIETVSTGRTAPAKQNRLGYRKNFQYNDYWAEKFYAVKQVLVIVADEPDKQIVVTVYTFYF
jgi:hypothetical protein